MVCTLQSRYVRCRGQIHLNRMCIFKDIYGLCCRDISIEISMLTESRERGSNTSFDLCILIVSYLIIVEVTCSLYLWSSWPGIKHCAFFKFQLCLHPCLLSSSSLSLLAYISVSCCVTCQLKKQLCGFSRGPKTPQGVFKDCGGHQQSHTVYSRGSDKQVKPSPAQL